MKKKLFIFTSENFIKNLRGHIISLVLNFHNTFNSFNC